MPPAALQSVASGVVRPSPVSPSEATMPKGEFGNSTVYLDREAKRPPLHQPIGHTDLLTFEIPSRHI